MAKPAYNFVDPTFAEVGLREVVDPLRGFTPASASGSDALQPGLVDQAMSGGLKLPQEFGQFTMPSLRPPARGDTFKFNPSTNELAVNDFVFSIDNPSAIIESEAALGSGREGPRGSGWLSVPGAAHQELLRRVKDPTFSEAAGQGFDLGVASGKQMLGAAGMATGIGGEGLFESASQRLEELAPTQRRFTDIDSGGDVLTWVASTGAQLLPFFLSSVLSAGTGAVLGAAGGVALRGMARALASKAAQKQVRKAAAKARANKPLTNAERGTLEKVGTFLAGAGRSISPGRWATRGAVTGAVGEAYAQGLGDIYAAQLEEGTEDRLTAFSNAIPYAALSLLPEAVAFGIATGIRPGVAVQRQAREGASREEVARKRFGTPAVLSNAERSALEEVGTLPHRLRRKSADVLDAVDSIGSTRRKRLGLGAGIGGVLEGTTEVGQEALVSTASGQERAVTDYVDAFAAGFLGGTVIGGTVGVLRKGREIGPEETSLTQPPSQLELFPDDDKYPGPPPPVDRQEPPTVPTGDNRLALEKEGQMELFPPRPHYPLNAIPRGEHILRDYYRGVPTKADIYEERKATIGQGGDGLRVTKKIADDVTYTEGDVALELGDTFHDEITLQWGEGGPTMTPIKRGTLMAYFRSGIAALDEARNYIAKCKGT